MMKKILLTLSVILFCTNIVHADIIIDNVRYGIGPDGYAKVDGYSGEPQDVVIRESINVSQSTPDRQVPVRSIDWYAFSGCTSLVSVTIPNTVTEICRYAFQGCTSLVSVTIPNSVTRIDNSVFSGCTSLVSVTLPNSVTEIGVRAFSECTSLVSVTLPNSLTSIWRGAFSGCASLESISIPGSVTFIGESAFSDCSRLKKVIFEKSDEIIKLVNAYCYKSGTVQYNVYPAFSNCPMLHEIEINRCLELSSKNGSYDSSKTLLWEKGIFSEVPVSELIIGPGCTVIPEMTFAGMEYLTKVSIPATVNLIMPDAFMDCTSLKNVMVEESADPLFMIGDFGKSGIEVLTLNRQFHEGAISVGELGSFYCKPSFAGCTSLTSINFGKNVNQ